MHILTYKFLPENPNILLELEIEAIKRAQRD